MIEEAQLNQVESIYKLGFKYDKNFNKLYNIESYINNDNYILLVYIEDLKIKGFIICENLIDSIDIELLYVDVNNRLKGIGKKLVESLLKYRKTINLEVSSNNIPALKLYDKCGFYNVGIRKNYYKDSDCIMKRKDK